MTESVNKIYLIISPYFPRGNNAYFSFVYDQVKAIQRCSQYEIVVVNPNSSEDYEIGGIRVWGVKVSRFLGGWIPEIVGWFAARKFMKAMFAHKLDFSRVCIAHGHLASSAKYCIAIKKMNPTVKTVVQFHDCDPFALLRISPRYDVGGLKTAHMFFYHRRQLEQIDYCVAISQNVARMAMGFPRQNVFNTYKPMVDVMRKCHWCRRARLRKVIVSHNGVDLSIFNEGVRSRSSKNEFVIGCVGRFVDLKDQKSLILAMASLSDKIKNWKLVFVGGGILLGECKALVDRLGIGDRVDFIERIEHSETARIYGMMDLFVLPSYFEGFGCVFLEAAACGVPFITCEGQGISDVLANQPKRWLVKQQSPIELAEKILAFYENRFRQVLNEPLDIDFHIKKLLTDLGIG